MKKLTIIGGGPAGYAAALYASNFDLETTLIESDTLGGTCLNRGCIPAKYWLHVAELNHEIETSNEFGIDIDCLLYTSPSPRDLVISRMPSSA